jgi:hypothetical protein
MNFFVQRGCRFFETHASLASWASVINLGAQSLNSTAHVVDDLISLAAWCHSWIVVFGQVSLDVAQRAER